MIPSPRIAVAVLAAGHGSRMKSKTSKVFHEMAGRRLVDHVRALGATLDPAEEVVVLGPEAPEMPGAYVVTQHERNGTGHAAQIALSSLSDSIDRVVFLYGDTPLVRPQTLATIAQSTAAVSLVTFEPDDPAQYGRIQLNSDGAPVGIVEFKDADEDQRRIGLCNGGLMAVDAAFLRTALPQLKNDNAQGEYYITDLVGLATASGLTCDHVVADPSEVLGVNSRRDLAAVEAEFQSRKRREAMDAGVTLLAPESVFFSHDTVLEADVLIEQNVVFGPGVTVRSDAVIRAFSHLEGADVGEGAVIGPYARLRPGSRLAEGSKVGNFVELKNTELGAGAKVNHLSYVGDAEVGAKTNIGAGTITCNYDGYLKHKTVLGEDVFIGSNSALVAPVVIADGATVAAGSTITKDIAPDALALARADQNSVAGAAARLRKRLKSKKEALKASQKKS